MFVLHKMGIFGIFITLNRYYPNKKCKNVFMPKLVFENEMGFELHKSDV